MKFQLNAWYLYSIIALSLLSSLVAIGVGHMLLHKVSPVEDAVRECTERADVAYYLSLYSTLVFVLLANVYYWQKGKTLFFFITFLYYGITTIAYYWLLEERFHFKKANGLWHGEFSLTYIGAVFFIIICALGLAINYSVIRYFRNQKIKTA